MILSLRPEQLRRYRDLARLLIKYGRADVVRNAGLDDIFDEDPAEPRAAEADELASDLEAMGPTYIKLGQLLSTRADLLPEAYLHSLARLQDDVKGFTSEEARRVVEDEIGVRISKAFQRFDDEPMAVASLGQVHYAVLRDGQKVAVKVQRPGVREQVSEDVAAVEGFVELLGRHTELSTRYDLPGVVQELRETVRNELNYRIEAANLDRLRENLEGFPHILVPRPIQDYSTSRVLTMEYMPGRKITELGPLDRMELDGVQLADELFEAYLQQTLIDGFFHADPHPGNLLITDEGRISLLDLGMVGQVSPRMQEHLLRLLLAISEGKGEEAAEVAMRIGDRLPWFDKSGFSRAISDSVTTQMDRELEHLQLGRVVMSVTRAAAEHGVRVPSDLTLLGKTLLNLDAVGRALDPGFDPNEAIQRHAAEILRKRMFQSASPGNLLSSTLEMTEFLQRLPSRLNRVLDRVATEELELKVSAFDEVHLMEGIQKLANRITMGLILAAVIVGAAMLMHVDTDFTLFGYPGFAMILFLLALVGVVALFIDILTHDEKVERGGSRHGGGRGSGS